MERFSDRHGRRPQIIAGVFLGAACIGAFAMSDSVLLFLGLAFGLYFSVVTSTSSALITDSCKAVGHGAAMGTLGSIMDIGHTTGSLVASPLHCLAAPPRNRKRKLSLTTSPRICIPLKKHPLNFTSQLLLVFLRCCLI
jgi:MFS family permease